MKEINVVQIGTGKMSRYTMRYLLEKGCNLVGAFDINPSIIGKKVNEVFTEVKSNVVITNIDELDSKLKELKPNVAIITTMSLLSDVYDVLKKGTEEARKVVAATLHDVKEAMKDLKEKLIKKGLDLE